MANISVTYTFTNGTVADGDQMNTNFTDIINGTSDGTKDFSISALTVASTATFNGAVTLGNATTDDITVTGSLASSIPVKTADTYDIGTAALPLRDVYVGDNGSSVGIGADAAASADWNFTFPPASGTKGYVMQTSGSGAHVWAPLQTDINAVSSSDYTVLDNDGYRHIHVTTGASDRTITLPTAADNTDRVITIKKIDSGAGTVIADGEGSETIDGATTLVLPSQYNTITLVCNGTGWHCIEKTIHGKYTPTVTNVGNLTNITAGGTYYSVNGRCVSISGRFTADLSSAGTNVGRISLPATIGSINFTSASDVAGVCSYFESGQSSSGGVAEADTTNDEIKISFIGNGGTLTTTDVNFTCHFNIP